MHGYWRLIDCLLKKTVDSGETESSGLQDWSQIFS